MKRKNFNFLSRTIMGLAVAASSLAISSYTVKQDKLAEGDFRFYNTSGIPNDPDPSHYVYRTNATLCDDEGPVCSEVWNIGTETEPADGTLLSDYASPTYAGGLQAGTYIGE